GYDGGHPAAAVTRTCEAESGRCQTQRAAEGSSHQASNPSAGAKARRRRRPDGVRSACSSAREWAGRGRPADRFGQLVREPLLGDEVGSPQAAFASDSNFKQPTVIASQPVGAKRGSMTGSALFLTMTCET